jgi:hypothetical protein
MNTYIQPLLGFGLVLAVLGSGCASMRQAAEEAKAKADPGEVSVAQNPPADAKEKAALEMDRHIVSTIRFTPGREMLTPETASVLERAIDEARIRGSVELIEVAVWPDAEYPAKGTELPKRQVKLASLRGQNIEKYVHNVQPTASVRVHNMATHSSTLGELFNTNDAEMKKKLVSLGVAPTPNEPAIVGRASTALVFIKVK